jgi:uncharacterized protein
MSLFQNVNVVSLYVSDWERAKKFYGEILDWPLCWSSDEVGWYEYGLDGQAHVSISRWEGPEPRPPSVGSTTLVLGVEDAKAVTAELLKRGVRCDDPIDVPGVVCYGSFYDPEGNRIQFASSSMS